MRRRSAEIFDDILYAQCWEDPEIDRAAFKIKPGDTVFSITSGGCNALAFLIDNPRIVYALDLNPRQNYLLDLKMGAFASLAYEEMLELLGVRPSVRRRELYARVRGAIGEESREYWDARQVKLEQGLIHTGRYEWYMSLLRRALERVKGQRLIRELFEAGDPAARLRLYRQRWDTPSWRLFTRVFLSRTVMSFLFTGEFFQYVEGSFSFGKHFARLVERALTRMPLRENYFVSYILLGRYFDEDHLPPYLMRDHFDLIRSRLARVRLITGTCGDFFNSRPDSSIQKFNFTNIFEWMPEDAFEGILREVCRVASPGAVMTYRNLLVFRERPPALQRMIRPDRPLAESLHARDRSFIYRNYVVERITKRVEQWSTRSQQSMIAGG
jgi:S-adenosylmethionine-diacylglycerol 3-amino-3-carboxypropyl transferase